MVSKNLGFWGSSREEIDWRLRGWVRSVGVDYGSLRLPFLWSSKCSWKKIHISWKKFNPKFYGNLYFSQDTTEGTYWQDGAWMDHALVKRQKSYQVHEGDSVSKGGRGFPRWRGYILWVQIVLWNSLSSECPKSRLNLAQKNCQFPQQYKSLRRPWNGATSYKKLACVQKILITPKKI